MRFKSRINCSALTQRVSNRRLNVIPLRRYQRRLFAVHSLYTQTLRATPPTRCFEQTEAMETLSPSMYQTQTSEMRSTNSSLNASTLPPADRKQPADAATESQESLASPWSVASSTVPKLATGSSNLSQLTAYTDLTSPLPEHVYDQRNADLGPQQTRLRTPEDAEINGDSYAITSPMSVASTNGTKRTASGHVKNAPSLPGTPLTAAISTSSRPRGDSVSSTSSRAGELAASLKTRLGYAMQKVQNGWEHRNISEVEQLAAQRAQAHRRSMSHLDYNGRPQSAGLTNGLARVSVYQDHAYSQNALEGPPSKRHSGNYSAYFASSSQPVQSSGPRLQPAADIRPTTSQYAHPPFSQPLPQASAMSPPRTPVNGVSYGQARRPARPPTIRTETQTKAAEQEALEALFQLGSPHASQMGRHQHSQANSSQASPLRSEFAMATPRRVTFARSESDSSAQLSAMGSEEGTGGMTSEMREAEAMQAA